MRQREAVFVDSGAWIPWRFHELRDLEQSWEYFRRTDLHKLSAVDATSFTIMKRARIRLAFAYDHHFFAAGFRLVT